jgi:hypothetical protein
VGWGSEGEWGAGSSGFSSIHHSHEASCPDCDSPKGSQGSQASAKLGRQWRVPCARSPVQSHFQTKSSLHLWTVVLRGS